MNRQSATRQSIPSKLGKSAFRAADYERPGVSAEEIQEIREAFDLFDPERTGFVSTAELLASLDSLGSEPRQQPLYHMIAGRVDEGVKQMQFEEFLDMMTNRVSTKDTKSDMRKVFQLFDEDSSGFISLKSLKKVVKELGENIDEAELQEMIQKADLDKDGQVSEEEFYNIMTKKEARL